MMTSPENIKTIQKELDWLETIILKAIKKYFLQKGYENDTEDLVPPDLSGETTPYATSIKKWKLTLLERLAVSLAMAPHFRPELTDPFLAKNPNYDKGFSEFGGLTGKNHSGFLPTAQTFFFLVSVLYPAMQQEALAVLGKENILIKEQVLLPGETAAGMPVLNALLGFNSKWFYYFLTGGETTENNTASFPAEKITTTLEWDDAIFDDSVTEQVMEIKAWAEHGETLMNDWGLNKKTDPGYRSLFYGPPGTGKTLTAALLGKSTGRELYKIDLTSVVSKYIGETEKNLSAIFDTAAYKNGILFFDEADALFGKRTDIRSSNDRYADQQISYLLQRIQKFSGIIILSSTLKDNIDEGFIRRFQSVIYFPMPSSKQRLQLWENAFSGTCKLQPGINLHKIAEDYVLSGGAIINVLRYCALAAVQRNDTIVTQEELLKGIQRELEKGNKTVSPF